MSDQSGDVDELLERIGAIEELLLKHDEQLNLRRDGGPYIWSRLKPAEARTLWHNLGLFVEWLDERYLRPIGGKREFEPCWLKHSVVIEELTALMVSYWGVYETPHAAQGNALVDWHERSLWPTLQSIAEYGGMRACRDAGGHRETRAPRELLTTGEDFQAALQLHLPSPAPDVESAGVVVGTR